MAKDIINIKGTKSGLVIYLDTEQDFEALKKNLKLKLESGRGFFKGAKFTFHQLGAPLSLEMLAILNEICSDNFLISDENISVPKSVKEQISATSEEYHPPKVNHEQKLRFQTQGVINEEELTPTVFLKHGLRSGQKIHYQGNVTILGDVNAGAEIVATGDIVIMGKLRGIAHAGALGNPKARIVAHRLQPSQLRIANAIGRSPDQTYPIASNPEIAHIVDGKIVIEEYTTNGMKSKKIF